MKLIKKYFYLLLLILIIAGCASSPATTSKTPAGLQTFAGVWKLEESYLPENVEYNYLVIKSDNTVESWTNRGLEQVFKISSEGDTLVYKTFSHAVPEWEGEELELKVSKKEDELYLIFSLPDQTKQWVQGFLPAQGLPVCSYTNNFDNKNLQYFKSDISGNGDEWQIIDDPDDNSNSILAPVVADNNSEADIQLSPGKNFIIEFDMKRKSASSSEDAFLMGLGFDLYKQSGKDTELYFDHKMELDIWYKIKVSVRDGKYFQFFRDETLFGEDEIDESYITGFKIIGNPDSGLWYMDNLTISWEVNSKDTYYTNFEEDAGDFYFNKDGATCDIAEIKGGELHLRAKKYDGFEAGAQAQFYKEIPRNSTIYFSIKFGENFNSQHPIGHFNFLQKNPNNRIDFMAGSDWFGYFTSVNGNQVDGAGVDYTFNTDQFYSFRYHLKEDTIDIYLDDVLLNSVDYVDGLPETGYFIFECHNEYWVKDFGYEIE